MKGPGLKRVDNCGGTLINHRQKQIEEACLISVSCRYVLTAAHCLCSTKTEARKKEGWCNTQETLLDIDQK